MSTPRSPQEHLGRLLAWRERCQGNRRRGERCALPGVPTASGGTRVPGQPATGGALRLLLWLPVVPSPAGC